MKSHLAVGLINVAVLLLTCFISEIKPDPCIDSVDMFDPKRYSNYIVHDNDPLFCDSRAMLNGQWYRFSYAIISDYCVPNFHCITDNTLWINGSLPTSDDTPKPVQLCLNYQNCCSWQSQILVQRCSDTSSPPRHYYVYQLNVPPATLCDNAICIDDCPYGQTLISGVCTYSQGSTDVVTKSTDVITESTDVVTESTNVMTNVIRESTQHGNDPSTLLPTTTVPVGAAYADPGPRPSLAFLGLISIAFVFIIFVIVVVLLCRYCKKDKNSIVKEEPLFSNNTYSELTEYPALNNKYAKILPPSQQNSGTINRKSKDNEIPEYTEIILDGADANKEISPYYYTGSGEDTENKNHANESKEISQYDYIDLVEDIETKNHAKNAEVSGVVACAPNKPKPPLSVNGKDSDEEISKTEQEDDKYSSGGAFDISNPHRKQEPNQYVPEPLRQICGTTKTSVYSGHLKTEEEEISVSNPTDKTEIPGSSMKVEYTPNQGGIYQALDPVATKENKYATLMLPQRQNSNNDEYAAYNNYVPDGIQPVALNPSGISKPRDLNLIEESEPDTELNEHLPDPSRKDEFTYKRDTLGESSTEI